MYPPSEGAHDGARAGNIRIGARARVRQAVHHHAAREAAKVTLAESALRRPLTVVVAVVAVLFAAALAL
ncbi:MAG TPA: hypothetical protein VNH39_14140, partial [Steroidobacteraceae bacterium]|nr:hypothetical protein [Steroidobacteraceae bacterium]